MTFYLITICHKACLMLPAFIPNSVYLLKDTEIPIHANSLHLTPLLTK